VLLLPVVVGGVGVHVGVGVAVVVVVVVVVVVEGFSPVFLPP
jgi:hypothetical protein